MAVVVRHGAHSDAALRPVAHAARRRLLRQAGLRASDLDGVGRALLRNWSRAAAALVLLERYADVHGYLDDDGNPRGFVRFWVAMVNSERLALAKLDEHLRQRRPAHDSALADYLDATYGDGDEDDE